MGNSSSSSSTASTSGDGLVGGDARPPLPPEVYLHIASFLDVGDVGAVARVSREWWSVVEQDGFWRGLYMRHFVLKQGRCLTPSGPRIAAWPAVKKQKKQKKQSALAEAGLEAESDSGSEDDGDDWRPENEETRARNKALAQKQMDAGEREDDDKQLEEEEMARIRREIGDDTPNLWRTCFRRRVLMKDGVCLIFMVGGNSLPYAADMVQKLRLHGVKVNSTCTIQLPYDGTGPHKGWQAELSDHLKHHSVAIFFANIAGADPKVRAEIGDQMTHFVEAGGSVVLAAFATCNVGESPGGLWQAHNYFPIILKGQTSTHVALDRHSENIDHPLYNDVRQVYVSYHGLGDVHPEAKLFGRWSDRTPAMARLKAKRGTVIAVNFFPPSSDIGDGGWPENGTGWVQKKDNSSARAWLYQFLERLSEGQARERGQGQGEGEGQGEDEAAGEETELMADMQIPPELLQLFRQVEEERGEGDFPWHSLLAKIDQDDQLEPGGEGGDDQKGNDAMVMLANAVKYGLWKASRLEPRRLAREGSTERDQAAPREEVPRSTDAPSSLRRAAMRSATCILS